MTVTKRTKSQARKMDKAPRDRWTFKADATGKGWVESKKVRL